MQQPRSDFGIAWADDGHLFAIGGQTGLDKMTETVEMLTSATAYATYGLSMGFEAMLRHSPNLEDFMRLPSSEGISFWQAAKTNVMLNILPFHGRKRHGAMDTNLPPYQNHWICIPCFQLTIASSAYVRLPLLHFFHTSRRYPEVRFHIININIF